MVYEAIFALAGTIVGFLLGWIKECIQNRPKLQIELKNGSLCYLKEDCDSDGNIFKEKSPPEVATKLALKILLDIFNIAKVGTGITDISVCISANNEKSYFQPKIVLPLNSKELDNISFNLEHNQVCTVELTLDLENNQENSYIFSNINIEPGHSNSLKIEVLVNSIKNRRLSLNIEPISLYNA